MANALTDFTKKREFLVCMDSDGCVMDTVRIKHSTVMCPELIRVFALDDYAEFITAAWDEINLHTITRGISRFESVRLVFDRLKNRGIEIPGSEDIAAWVDTANELSTASLQRELQKTGSLALRKLQEWNNACNRRIQALEPTFEPFPGVEESLRQLHAVADVAVVSAANESAIASEWKRYGLARHADVIFGQEVGSKANSIATMLACGYESRKVMMVGDAMGDAQAAAANGVAFVPILPAARPTAGGACRRKPCRNFCTAPSARNIRLNCWPRCAAPCTGKLKYTKIRAVTLVTALYLWYTNYNYLHK